MYLSSEDARSDFILAVAAVFLGRYAFELIAQVPGYPLTGHVGTLLIIVWQALLTGAAAFALARHRGDVPSAFALEAGRRGSVVVGVLVALPLLVAHVLPEALRGDVGALGLSLLGRFTERQPALGGLTFSLDLVWLVVSVLVLAVGMWLFTAFLATRAREAFVRSPDMDLTEVVRTFGMGGVGLSLVLGLLATFRGLEFANALLVSATLLAVVLLTDRQVPPRTTTTRATVLGPVIAVGVLHVLAGGGLFSGDLLLGLYFGSAAAVVTLCAVTLAEVRQGWAVLVLVVASVLYGIPIDAHPLPCSMVLCL